MTDISKFKNVYVLSPHTDDGELGAGGTVSRLVESGANVYYFAFSTAEKSVPKEFAKKIPGTKNNTNFWSSGISVVFHPKNPKIPTMHFNTRFICTQKSWFGGGMDVTPCIVDNKEKFKEWII